MPTAEPPRTASPDDLALVRRLRDGDEEAFMALVDELRPTMLRVARMYVASNAVAEDVVQDAWVGVLKGLDGFEGRSSLRTWILRILVNIAKTRGVREGRTVPFASLAGDDLDRPSWDASRFLGDDAAAAGSWSTLPPSWADVPEDRLLSAETLRLVGAAIDALPPMQAAVLRLRDILGWSSDEVRNALDLSETNQRVLLHRARAKVRAALAPYLERAT